MLIRPTTCFSSLCTKGMTLEAYKDRASTCIGVLT